MGIYSIIISIVLIIGIPIFELSRKKESVIDFLSPVNFMFLLLYGIVPIYLYTFDQHITWSVLKRTDMHNTVFFFGVLLVLLFYFILIICYYSTNKLTFTQRLKSMSEQMYGKVQVSQFFKVALILFFIGGVSLIIYIQELGGYREFMRLGELIRNDGSVYYTPLAFLKRFTPFLYLSTFMFFAFIKESKGIKKILVVNLFIVSAIGALITAVQNSGRLTLLTFIITIPIAYMVRKNKIQIRTLVFAGILLFLLASFGSQILSKNDNLAYTQQRTPIEITTQVVEEFSFPFNNIANVITVFPNEFNYRLGLPDIIYAIIEYVPSSLLDFEYSRLTASQFNTTLYNNYGQIPVDIVTFGYMSFGVAGVMLVAALFGFFLRIIESLFYYKGSLISCIFFVSLMLQMTYGVMYGDPHQVFLGFFKYFVALFLIFLFVKRANRKGRIKHSEYYHLNKLGV